MTLSSVGEVYSELPEDGSSKGWHCKVGCNSFFCPRLLIGEGVAGRDASMIIFQSLEHKYFLKLSQDIKFKEDQRENLRFVQNGRQR